MDDNRKRQYFAELAPKYNILTGNTTQDIFAKWLDSTADTLEITSSSIIHDNASGPGTATQVLVEHATKADTLPTVVATDYAPGMINHLNNIIASQSASKPAWTKVSARVIDSSDLSSIPDDHFTHSISNFSLFTITNPIQSLRETYRTLAPGGTAVVLLWKRYAVQDILARAQDIVKGEGYAKEHAVPVNGPQYFEEGIVERQMAEAGFEIERMATSVVEYVLKESEVGSADRWKWGGLVEYLTGSSIAAGSTRGWSEEEVSRWPVAVNEALKGEQTEYGGVKFESWVTVAKK